MEVLRIKSGTSQRCYGIIGPGAAYAVRRPEETAFPRINDEGNWKR